MRGTVTTSFATPRSPDTQDLAVLDVLRGLAALYVMLGHAWWLLWGGYHEYVTRGGRHIGRILALGSEMLRFGHQAVLLFFLISGFCIHYRQAQKIAVARAGGDTVPRSLLNLRSYAQRRMRRLYPALLAALALTALCDYVGSRLNPRYYAGLTSYPLINANLGHSSHTLSTLVGNLLLQPTFSVPAFGTNGPLWSLAYEFWFYVLYPVLLALLVRFGHRGTISIVALVSLTGIVAYQPAAHANYGWLFDICSYWIVWVVGALIAEAYATQARVVGLNWMALASVGGLMILGIVTLHKAQYATVSDLAWSAGLAILLAYLMLSPPLTVRSLSERVGHRLVPLGNISYSLYVVHFPWLALVSAWWLASHERLPLGAELAIPGAVSALLVAVCSWYLVERHFVTPRPMQVLHGRAEVAAPRLGAAGMAAGMAAHRVREESVPAMWQRPVASMDTVEEHRTIL